MADTLNISPDEKIAGVPLARLLRNLEDTSYNEGALDLACRLSDCKAVIEALLSDRAATKAAAPADAPTAPMCERKTNDIIQRDGYRKTGYVLRKEGTDICVSDGGAVAWFTLDQWNWLLFNRMHTTFDWPKPLGWRAPAEDAREEVRDELIHVGAMMANTMFNLAQRTGDVIDSDLAAKFDKMRKEWDTARRASSVHAIPGTGEGAEFLAEVFNRLTQEQKLSVPQEAAGRLGAFMVRNGYRIVFGRWYLQAAPSHPSEAQTCTCPSGDGSLRWPCPVHPSEAKAGEDA